MAAITQPRTPEAVWRAVAAEGRLDEGDAAGLGGRYEAELQAAQHERPAPKAKNASGRGLASGRSTILVMPSSFFWGV